MKFFFMLIGVLAAVLSPKYRHVVADTIGTTEPVAIGLAGIIACAPLWCLGYAFMSDARIQRDSMAGLRPDDDLMAHASARLPGVQRMYAVAVGIFAFWFQAYLIYKCFHQ